MATTVLAGEHIVSADTLRDLKSSLPRLGAGVSRTAYDLGNGSVLKVGAANGMAGGNATEVACWESMRDSDIGQYLCPVIAYDEEQYAWLIMRKVDGTLGDNYAAYQAWRASGIAATLYAAGISDLHEGNVGYVDDGYGDYKFFVIDYAMNDEACDAEWGYNSNADPSHCSTCCNGCTDHEWRGRSDACCSVAKFRSDDCATLMGCREEICDAPACGNLAIHDLGTLLRLERNEHWNAADHVWISERANVCGHHKPVGKNSADWMREMGGQLPMFGRLISRQPMNLRLPRIILPD